MLNQKKENSMWTRVPLAVKAMPESLKRPMKNATSETPNSIRRGGVSLEERPRKASRARNRNRLSPGFGSGSWLWSRVRTW